MAEYTLSRSFIGTNAIHTYQLGRVCDASKDPPQARLPSRSTHSILYDDRISDAALQEQARAHLQVLDSPTLQKWNRPGWVDSMLHPRSKFTAKRLFEAFYETAQDLGLKRSGRYFMPVSAPALVLLVRAPTPIPIPTQYGRNNWLWSCSF